MILSGDEMVFLIVLIVNLLAALGYLLTGMYFVIPARRAAKGEEEEELFNNERTYLLHFVVMLLCPVIGLLFFAVSHLFYMIVFRGDVDLADVMFSKARTRMLLKADEERERDLVSLEEALLVNEKRNLRRVMMNVIREDIQNSLNSITLALDSSDSETSHYAAAVLSDELNKFRIYVQKLWKQIQEEGPEETENEEILLDYMNNILRQHIFSDQEQCKFVGYFVAAAESLYGKAASRLTLTRYENVCMRTLEIKDFDVCKRWCDRIAERFPQELSSYTCNLKLYFAQQKREAFFETLDSLKKSKVVVDNETLELIRIFN